MDENKAALIEEDEVPSSEGDSKSSRLITVEPALALFAISVFIQSTVQGQYLYFAVGQQYNLTSVNQSKAYQCSDNSSSTQANSSEKELVDELQDLTSMWNMYISIANYLAGLIVVPFLSPMTDRLGRKWALQLVVIGDLVRLSINTAAMFFSWPIYVFVATSVISGLTGSFGLMLATAFSYLADITTSKERPFRITIVECSYALSGSLTDFAVGFWLTSVSYQWPYVLAIGASILNLIYIFFILPEVRGRHSDVPKTFQIKRIVEAYTGRGRNTGSMIFAILGLLLFCLQGAGSSVEEQYEMGLPFCWSSVLIGVFSGVQKLGLNVGMLFATGIFTKCFGLHSITIALIGIVSSMTSKVIIGLAKTTTDLFLSSVVGIFSILPIPMIRTYLSLEVDKNEQGAIFASIAMVEIVCKLFSSTATNTIYRLTEPWFPGFIFLVLAGVGGVSFVFNAISLSLHLKKKTKMKYQMIIDGNINVDDEDQNDAANPS